MAPNQTVLRTILAELERLVAMAERDDLPLLAYLIDTAASEARDELKRLAS